MSVRLTDFSRAQIGAMVEVLKEALDAGFAEKRGDYSESGLVYEMLRSAEAIAEVEDEEEVGLRVAASRILDGSVTITEHQLIHDFNKQFLGRSGYLIAECACGWCSEPVTVYGAATESAISEANRRGIAHLIDMGSKGNGVITWPDWAKP